MNTAYEKYYMNYEECLPLIKQAFVDVLGEDNREIISERLDNTKVLNYILPQHLEYYQGKTEEDVQAIKQDNQTAERITNERTKGALIKALIPFANNPIINSELQKMQNDNYISPLLKLKFYNIDMLKHGIMGEILKKLNLVEDLPPIKYADATKRNEFIDHEWPKFFTNEETEAIANSITKSAKEIDAAVCASQGNIEQMTQYYNNENYDLIQFSSPFTAEFISESPNHRYFGAAYNATLDKPFLYVANPLLKTKNEDALIAFIHELSHAISADVFKNERGELICNMGIGQAVNADKENGYTPDSTEFSDEYTELNEAITQIIATKVTEKLIDQDIAKKLFSFELPPQKANLLSSYPEAVEAAQELVENNFEVIKNHYIRHVKPDSLHYSLTLQKTAKICKAAHYSKMSKQEIEEYKNQTNPSTDQSINKQTRTN